MGTKRFPINREDLFDNRTERYALIYDDTNYMNGSVFDERGNWEYVNRKEVYEQVEFFDSMPMLKCRQEELSKISNKHYSNFTCVYNPKYL